MKTPLLIFTSAGAGTIFRLFWAVRFELENIKNNKTVLIKEPKYREGTPVRIYKYKTHFEKGYKSRWTKEVFTISKVFPADVTTYERKDENGENIKGRFYEAEIRPSIFPATDV